MQTTPQPEIDATDIRTVKQFLTSLRDEDRRVPPPRPKADASRGAVTVRNGITRARSRRGASADS